MKNINNLLMSLFMFHGEKMSKHNSSQLNDLIFLTAKAAAAKSKRHASYITEERIANDILSSVRKMTEYGANEIWYTKYSYSKTNNLPDAEARALEILRSLGYGVTHTFIGGAGLKIHGSWVLHVVW